jgi:hypothetical protein
MNTENIINKWELLWNSYVQSKNIDALDELLDDDFIFYDENGGLNKKDFIEDVKIFTPSLDIISHKIFNTDDNKNFIYLTGKVEVSKSIFNIVIKDTYHFIIECQNQNSLKINLLKLTKIISN